MECPIHSCCRSLNAVPSWSSSCTAIYYLIQFHSHFSGHRADHHTLDGGFISICHWLWSNDIAHKVAERACCRGIGDARNSESGEAGEIVPERRSTARRKVLTTCQTGKPGLSVSISQKLTECSFVIFEWPPRLGTLPEQARRAVHDVKEEMLAHI